MDIITLLLIGINVIVSYKGFNSTHFFDKYKFDVEKVLVYKDYKRLVTGGFLHVSWSHLIINMLTLIFFSDMSAYLGLGVFVIVYFASLIGGCLLCLLVHKNHGDYSAVGASGAIAGVVFASIVLVPGMHIGLFLLPSLPGIIYGIIYIIYTIYGIKTKKGNVSHEGHLGGALTGMLVTILFYPSVLQQNLIAVALLTVPTVAFIILIIKRPQILITENFFGNTQKNQYSIDHKYNADRSYRQKELDRLLDKINTKGLQSLSMEEKQRLNEYSKRVS